MRNGTIVREIVSRNISKWQEGQNCGVDKLVTLFSQLLFQELASIWKVVSELTFVESTKSTQLGQIVISYACVCPCDYIYLHEKV